MLSVYCWCLQIKSPLILQITTDSAVHVYVWNVIYWHTPNLITRRAGQMNIPGNHQLATPWSSVQSHKQPLLDRNLKEIHTINNQPVQWESHWESNSCIHLSKMNSTNEKFPCQSNIPLERHTRFLFERAWPWDSWKLYISYKNCISRNVSQHDSITMQTVSRFRYLLYRACTLIPRRCKQPPPKEFVDTTSTMTTCHATYGKHI